METQEYYYISPEELDEADRLISGSSIEINPPTNLVQEIDGELVAKKSEPWIKISTAFRKSLAKKLKGSKISVFLVIALHINEDCQSFPSVETLSQETGYSPREVKYAIHELEDMGLLTISIGKRKSNLYTIKAMFSYGKNKPKTSGAENAPLKHANKSVVHSATYFNLKSPQNTRQNAPEVELRRTINTRVKKKLQEKQEEQQPSSPAPLKGDPVNIDEYKERIAESMIKGMVNASAEYAHYPERVRPIVERMCALWHFRAPTRSKSKDGKYAFWITTCEEILEGCAEFGAGMLDELYADWAGYLSAHQGLAPYSVNSPKSLVSAVEGKAALLRSGSHVSYFARGNGNGRENVRQSRLDV